MERVANLSNLVKREVAEYAWDEKQSKAYFMANEERHVYSVPGQPTPTNHKDEK